MTTPLVYVLVINWNGRGHLQECFGSLLESTYPNARYLLIDNGSTDDSIEYMKGQFGPEERVEILRIEKNAGWSGGNNAGIEYALGVGADYVFLLNNDTVTAPDAITHLVDAAEADRRIGALAPKILLYDNPDLLNSIGLEAALTGAAWDRGLGRMDGPQWDEVRPVAGVCGAAMFLRAEVFRETGLFAPEFEIYLDDLDLCLRIWSVGYTVQTCPTAVVRHKFSATMGEGALARRKYYLNTRNRLRVILRNFPVRHAAKVLRHYAHAEIRAIGRAVLDGEPSRVWAHVRATVSGVLYLPHAIKARAARARTKGSFWNLLCSGLHFFPGVEFPRDGWYGERSVGDRVVQPMAIRAHVRHPGGTLRVTVLQAFPHLGPVEIECSIDGQPMHRFQTDSSQTFSADIPPGNLHFKGLRIFRAEETGETFDCMGWASIYPAGGDK